jgi:hypothetical protein
MPGPGTGCDRWALLKTFAQCTGCILRRGLPDEGRAQDDPRRPERPTAPSDPAVSLVIARTSNRFAGWSNTHSASARSASSSNSSRSSSGSSCASANRSSARNNARRDSVGSSPAPASTPVPRPRPPALLLHPWIASPWALPQWGHPESVEVGQNAPTERPHPTRHNTVPR